MAQTSLYKFGNKSMGLIVCSGLLSVNQLLYNWARTILQYNVIVKIYIISFYPYRIILSKIWLSNQFPTDHPRDIAGIDIDIFDNKRLMLLIQFENCHYDEGSSPAETCKKYDFFFHFFNLWRLSNKIKLQSFLGSYCKIKCNTRVAISVLNSQKLAIYIVPNFKLHLTILK